MKEQFRTKKISSQRLALLEQAQTIIDHYQTLEIKMTLRQLHYQLVKGNIIENTVREYKKLGELLIDARYNGLVDWDAIEDRLRVPTMHSAWDNIDDLVKSAIYSYRLPRWRGQRHYLELFSEKDALSSVLAPIADKWHIHFCVNRGYSSATAMYDLSKRIAGQLELGRMVKILYLGDHDPSGLDMIRDIHTRITEFLKPRDTLSAIKGLFQKLEVVHIALTMPQIKKYNPPPNPARITDPRAKAYIAQFGNVSWEVDALKPEVMMAIVDKAIEQYVDTNLMDAIKLKEDREKKALREFAKTLVAKK